jgi:hypothetical protein
MVGYILGGAKNILRVVGYILDGAENILRLDGYILTHIVPASLASSLSLV